jgi:hypothetical protein|tara:strand:- start:8244 stop:8459 length:216 start_codon:yes stop_codon:yes gene_type:complete
MDYKALQVFFIKHYDITIDERSNCWKRMHAHVDGTRRVCKWKPVNSFNALFDLLHEIGHIQTHRRGLKRAY